MAKFWIDVDCFYPFFFSPTPNPNPTYVKGINYNFEN